MRNFLLSVFVALAGFGLAIPEADAKRLGGGGSSGLQRSMPARQAPATPPPKQAPAATPGTPGAAPAAAGRSWMGPIAGLAAGLGLAALMSHLGLGEEMANMLTIVLLAVAAIWLVRFLARRFASSSAPAAANGAPQGLQYAGHLNGREQPASPPPMSTSPAAAAASGAGTGSASLAQTAGIAALPAGFDAAAFERIAKLIFIRMQAANDKADLEDLRQFSTPEMFAVFKLDLQERHSAPQQTDVVQLAAELVDFEQDATRQIVSVRFHGLIREERDAAAAPFDEIWHLVKPLDGSREWAIAGIAQAA